MKALDTVPVSEVFGPVWQGEGPWAGRRCSFLRLGLCNLSCEWCDTPFTWDRTRFDVDAECPPRTAPWIVGELVKHDTELVVISGGEPLMHQTNRAFVDVLEQDDWAWHIETNGTIAPRAWLTERVSHFTVSPKVSTRDPEKKRIKVGVLDVFADLAVQGKAAWKVVCQDEADVERADELFELYGVPSSARWVMPEGVTTDQVIRTARRIAPLVGTLDLNFTLRMHTLLYGTERAR